MNQRYESVGAEEKTIEMTKEGLLRVLDIGTLFSCSFYTLPELQPYTCPINLL